MALLCFIATLAGWQVKGESVGEQQSKVNGGFKWKVIIILLWLYYCILRIYADAAIIKIHKNNNNLQLYTKIDDEWWWWYREGRQQNTRMRFMPMSSSRRTERGWVSEWGWDCPKDNIIETRFNNVPVLPVQH